MIGYRVIGDGNHEGVKDDNTLKADKPTHKEIMTLWWEILDDVWQKVNTYNRDATAFGSIPIYIFDGNVEGGIQIGNYERYYVTADWFIGRKYAAIPPE